MSMISSAFTKKQALLAITGSCLALTVAQAALAQDVKADGADAAPGDIVVTAQRRNERQVDVPITITALSQRQLQTANVVALPDIAKITPGLRFDNTGAFFQPTIRGVGTPVVTSGGGSNVGIYVDGFYVPNPLAGDFKLMNVESVQVLKGPQGTLFGHNTTGGAILVQSAEPSETTAVEGKVSYGRFNEVQAKAYATTGVTSGVAMDIEGAYNRGDGWQTNISNGQRVGDHDDWSVRLGLKAELGGSASLLLRYQHSDVNDPTPLLVASYRDPVFGSGAHPAAYITPNGITYDPRQVSTGAAAADQERLRIKADVVQATLKADLGFANLTSYTQYRWEDVDVSQELDFTGAGIFQIGIPNQNRTWSQEVLLTSKTGSKLQWTAGLFAFGNKDIYSVYADELFFNPIVPRLRFGGSGTNTKSYAGFLDMTYEVAPRLYLTAGARYAHDEVTDAYYNVANGRSAAAPLGIGTVSVVPLAGIKSNRVTPRVVVRYKPDDQSSVYASFTRGYKSAIIDAGGSCQNATNIPTAENPTGKGFTCNNVKPETITAYEVGYKFDNRVVSFELSGFYYDYKNLQVSVYLLNAASVLNAATSRIYGLDGQLNVRVSDNFQINAAGAWTHARYRQFPLAPVYAVAPCAFTTGCADGRTFDVVTRNLQDSPMQRAPEFTGNVGARYSTQVAEGALDLSGNLSYSSKFYFGPSGTQFPQKAFATLALRAQWTDPSKHYTVALFGDNVTNTKYLSGVQYSSYGVGANWAKPVTWGLELGAKF